MSATRFAATVSYDGADFAGSQLQPRTRTVQGELEDAAARLFGAFTRVRLAGRTDAGVHAKGQICHVDLPRRAINGFELAKAITANIKSSAVSILRAEEVSDQFHARFSAVNKLYTYRILRRSAPPALDAGRVWHFKRDLNVANMQNAAKYLLGNHDFTTFRATQCQAKSPVRTLDRLDVTADGDEIRISASARSFLHNQVRSMVGSLKLVGDRKWTTEDLRAALEARDRTACGPVVPPTGLYLMAVDYD